MVQHANGRPPYALHGTQVGIATLMSAMLYERLLALDAFPPPPPGARIASVEASHPDLPLDVVAEVRKQYDAKRKDGEARAEELARVSGGWQGMREGLRETVVPPARIAEALSAAGAADRPSAIGVDRDFAIHTVRVCRQIRSRYVALDLLDDLGLLHGWAAEVVDALERAPAE